MKNHKAASRINGAYVPNHCIGHSPLGESRNQISTFFACKSWSIPSWLVGGTKRNEVPS